MATVSRQQMPRPLKNFSRTDKIKYRSAHQLLNENLKKKLEEDKIDKSHEKGGV